MYDINAIMQAYPECTRCSEVEGAFDKDGNKITLDQTKVDAERAAIDKEIYKIQRYQDYPEWGVQLDYIYHHGIDKWKTDIVDPVKAKYPKPS
tara:strand:- start:115 stop:393 length:279 start_codon:yes stop_codon:yes gene_type:complete